MLNIRHDGYISIVFSQHLLQLCEDFGILYQKLLYITYIPLTETLGLVLRCMLFLQR